MIAYKPIQRTRIELGQFSPFINPMEITGDQTPMTTPSPSAPASGAQSPTKAVLVATSLLMTGISAATAYVGVSYGMEKGRSDVKRALGWTVGVLGALSGLVRFVGTGALLFMPEGGYMARNRT